MTSIVNIHGLEILDSRGNPTVKVFVALKDGTIGSACAPSGASTGEHEAVELRDKDPKRYLGKGTLTAVENVNTTIKKALLGKDALNQKNIDQHLIDADGTKNKSKLGANAIIATSLAVCKAASLSQKKPLYTLLGSAPYELPVPMMNIINGGAHADNFLDFQEFMIRPVGPKTFREKLRCGAEIFHALKALLHEKNHVTAVGDEGGFAPMFASNEEALDYIMLAIEKAGYKPKEDVTIALDAAASEFYDKPSKKYIEKKKKLKKMPFVERTYEELTDYFFDLCKKYPIDSIEDPLDENDWEGWAHLTEKLKHIQIVGDDLFVTNKDFLQRGINEKVANAILIKFNQIGTLSETLETIALAKANNYKTIISHRSGETEDTFIADLAVGANALQIKTGSLSRSDRVAKYNRLLEIEELL